MRYFLITFSIIFVLGCVPYSDNPLTDANKEQGELEALEFSGHTSSLEGNKYLNLKWVRPVQDEITGYMFVKYIVSSDSLGIALMDSKVAEKAIKDGVLKG